MKKMRKQVMNITTAALISLLAMAANAQAKLPVGKFAIDATHSKVGFEVAHLVVSSVDGKFTNFSGEIELSEKIESMKVDVTIEASSIDTANAKRDEHLKSADFFDVPKFGKITFKSKKVSGKSEAFKLVGDLSIKGITKEVTLTGKFHGVANDGYGNDKAAFSATTKFSRKDFGLTWNNLIENSPAVGDEILVTLKIEAGKPKSK